MVLVSRAVFIYYEHAWIRARSLCSKITPLTSGEAVTPHATYASTHDFRGAHLAKDMFPERISLLKNRIILLR